MCHARSLIMHSVKSNDKGDSDSESENEELERGGVGGRLRLLRAGAWHLLHTCRCVCV
jgi:hypothetical protein